MNNRTQQSNKMTFPILKFFLLFYYVIVLTESKSISVNGNGEPIINTQDSFSNSKLNWLLETCITDVEEVLMGLEQGNQIIDHGPVDDGRLFHLLNCEDMGIFLNKLQTYHRQLVDFPVMASDDNNLEMNKWFKRTEKNIRKYLSELQSDCAPYWNLQDIMDNFLDCLLKTGYSMGRGAENGYTEEDPSGEEQRIKSLLLALKSRSTTAGLTDQPLELQHQFEHVGGIDLVLDSHIREVPPTFLSVALGSKLIQNEWAHFNTSSHMLRTLTSALSPAILRMGGSSANYLTYDPTATTKKHFHSCQDIDGLQLEDLDPFNFEDMYDSNIDGNPFNLESEHENMQPLSDENLSTNEDTFNDYYSDNMLINADWLVRPDQANFDNFVNDLETKTHRLEDYGSSKFSNDPFNTIRDALSHSNWHQENHGFSDMDESNNNAQSSNNILTNKLNGMNDWSNIFDMSQTNERNHVSSDNENSITLNTFPLQPFNKHKKKVHTVDSEPNDNMNGKFSIDHFVFDNLHDLDNLQNKKNKHQNRNRRYWSQDQHFEERLPGYQARRFRRNLDSSNQYPLTDFLNRRSNSRHDFSSITDDHSIDDLHNGIHNDYGPGIPNIIKSDNDLITSPNMEAAIGMENQQNINKRHRMNHENNPNNQYYDHGVKHLYKDKQSSNYGSQNEHDWVYHHGMIHNHDLREHLENIDSNTDFIDIESENNQHNDQHIRILNYDDQGCSCEYQSPVFTNFTMTGDDFNSLLEFAEAVNMSLLWDMNHFYREADGSWDPTNARMIIQEVSSKKQTVIWQLGNEPNSYAHHSDFSITGRQDALDYGAFRRELQAVFPEVTIVGPDTTRPRFHGNRISDAFGYKSDAVTFMREFLTYGSQDIDVVSWHQYYLDGRTSIVDDFLDPNLMDVLIKQVETMVAVRDELAPGKPIWITETSSAYGGGAPELSNRYVAGFLWLDKLGLSARKGVDLVARQTLYHGCYALLDPYLQPYPDYWLSVIYKQQVGGRVLDMQLSTSIPTVRLYAHCLNPTSQHYKQGGVVVYGMNVGDKGASVSLEGRLNETHVLEMILQPPEGDLQSSSVMLNGVVVELTSQNYLPSLNARPSNVHGALHIPSHSMGFWLLPNAKAQACH